MHKKIHTLEGWLAHCERLHPTTSTWAWSGSAKSRTAWACGFDCPVITVAGTNGKGSTCAMIEAVAQEAGYRTGVYASPHLVHFEERCRIAGDVVAATDLLPHFEAVESARTLNGNDVSLTYFEFTTLVILRLMSHALLDVAILEVGLGGRLDATNVIDADCAVITSIDIDHVEFLGPDRESIGREKAGIMRTGRPVVVSDPMPPQSVLDHAREIGADLWRFGQDFNFAGDKQQWAGRARPPLRRHGLSGAAWSQPVGECLGRAGGAGGTARAHPHHSAGGAQRPVFGRVAGTLPDHSGDSPPWCWMWRTTRIRWRR